VIVAGPHLKLHQCGLPKLMALELFKPFIMSRLVERKIVQNIKAAKRHVDQMQGEVWDILEEVIQEHPVLLNRAPTLHRLGIQAFEPTLVEGKAIQVHPLVCHAFNADFDGDQMAVHVPLSAEAQAECRILMLSANNILSPASGRALATPTQDMVLGSYYLTYSDLNFDELTAEEMDPRPKRFRTEEEVEFSVESKQITLQQPIEYLWEGQLVLTTAGRVIFNAEIDRALRVSVGELDGEYTTYHDFLNRTLSKKELGDFISILVDEFGAHAVASVLDTIKDLGFLYGTKAGVTISKNDVVIPPNKEKILAEYEERVAKVEQAYEHGLITESERHESIVNTWTEATETVAQAMTDNLQELNPIYMMANSGARGSFTQLRQLAGMRGLMANPKGEIIERPIKANFMEGLSVLEYFISTHGARKGLADTALRTADSGYLTRRLVDVSQDVIIREADCGSKEYVELPLFLADGMNKSVAARILAEDIHKPLAVGQARQDGDRRGRRGDHDPAPARDRRGARGRRRDVRRPGALGAQVQGRGRRVPGLLRHVPRDRRDVGDRRRGRHHRRAVDRRAGHAADDADVPHRRHRRRGHHARPAACRRDLRGAEPEGRRAARGDRRDRRARGDRPADQAHDPAGERQRGGREGVHRPASHAFARRARPGRRAGRCAARGLDQPG